MTDWKVSWLWYKQCSSSVKEVTKTSNVLPPSQRSQDSRIGWIRLKFFHYHTGPQGRWIAWIQSKFFHSSVCLFVHLFIRSGLDGYDLDRIDQCSFTITQVHKTAGLDGYDPWSSIITQVHKTAGLDGYDQWSSIITQVHKTAGLDSCDQRSSTITQIHKADRIGWIWSKFFHCHTCPQNSWTAWMESKLCGSFNSDNVSLSSASFLNIVCHAY